MAYKHHIRSIMAFLAIFCICIQASALSTSRYATNSKLASGHWVKVKVDKNGIYELTYDELNDMGFSSPQKCASMVRVDTFSPNRSMAVKPTTSPQCLMRMPTTRFSSMPKDR